MRPNFRSRRLKPIQGYSLIELTLVLAVIASGVTLGLQLHNYSQAKSQGSTIGTLMSTLNSGVGAYLSLHYRELMALPDACSQTNFRIGDVVASPVGPDFDKCQLSFKNGLRVVNGMQPTLTELSSLGYLSAGLQDAVPWAAAPVVVGSVDGTETTKLMPARFAVLVEKVDLPGTCDKFLMVDGAMSSDKSFWAQDINLSAGSTYEFTYWVAGSAGVQLQARVDGANTGSSAAPSAGGPWTRVVVSFRAPKANVRVALFALSTGDAGNDFAIDDISLRLIDDLSSAAIGPNLIAGGDFNSGVGNFVSDYLLQPQISVAGTAAMVASPPGASGLGISAGRGGCTPRALRSLVFNLQPYDADPWLGALRLSWAAHKAGTDALLSKADDPNAGELLAAGGVLSGWRNPLRTEVGTGGQGLAHVLAMRNGHGSQRTGYRQQEQNRYTRRDPVTVAATADWDFASKSLKQLDRLEVHGQLSSQNIKLNNGFSAGSLATGGAVTMVDGEGSTTLRLLPDGQVLARKIVLTDVVRADSLAVTGNATTQRLNVGNTAKTSQFAVAERLFLGPSRTRGNACDPGTETLARDAAPDYSQGEGLLQCAPSTNRWIVWRGPQGEVGPAGP